MTFPLGGVTLRTTTHTRLPKSRRSYASILTDAPVATGPSADSKHSDSLSLKFAIHTRGASNLTTLSRRLKVVAYDTDGNSSEEADITIRRTFPLTSLSFGEASYDVSVSTLEGPPVALSLQYTGGFDFPFSRDDLYMRHVDVFDPATPEDEGIHFPVHAFLNTVDQEGRVFFSAASTLPNAVSPGLMALRQSELATHRGERDYQDPDGLRVLTDRIYDFEVYNDLGDGEPGSEGARAVLGGPELPYPRRQRTNRPMQVDGVTESKGALYVPRDEEFHPSKKRNVARDTTISAIPTILQTIKYKLLRQPEGFTSMKDYESIFVNDSFLRRMRNKLYEAIGRFLQSRGPKKGHKGVIANLVDRVLIGLMTTTKGGYPFPEAYIGRETAWKLDEEFGRLAVAGQNPGDIRCVSQKEWAALSSSITDSHVQSQLEGASLTERIAEGGRIFVLDHTYLKPRLAQINARDGAHMYASITLFYLTDGGKLMPVAIDLEDDATRAVYTPSEELQWPLAKIYAGSANSARHQVHSHFLRTHAVVEPFIIAMQRQVSTAHPVYKLMRPHYRYTMNLNAAGRGGLITGGGAMERIAATAEYTMEASSLMYRDEWRFDQQALPEDLISRGMAIRADDGQIDLVLKDYPYAADGLLLWTAIEDFVGDYLSQYYDSDQEVADDPEIGAWWDEVQRRGHPDKDEGWPALTGIASLTRILSTIMWITSGMHAAINFGSYAYYGFMPQSPAWTRQPMPTEQELSVDAEASMMSVLPTRFSTMLSQTVNQILSDHEADEQYLGDLDNDYLKEGKAAAALRRFNAAIQAAEDTMRARNEDPSLRIRNSGAVDGNKPMAYRLLHVSSGQGVTGQGVPNSISI